MYARDKTWYTLPKNGNPRLVWLYITGAHGLLHNMHRQTGGGLYEFGYMTNSLKPRPGAITKEALRYLKVIP